MITAAALVAATGCSAAAAERFALPIADACALWQIDTPARAAAFVGQIAFESAKFTTLREVLTYSTAEQLVRMWPTRFRMPAGIAETNLERFADGRRNPYRYTMNAERLAEYVYGGRLGNRPEGYGDGWAFRGAGLIQITGRANFAAYSKIRGIDAVRFPDMLEEPAIAADASAYFWHEHGLNELADEGNDLEITRRITGGLTGWQVPDQRALSDRRELVASAREVFA